MGSYSRLSHIRSLLDTALDSEEEYLYEGEMSSYPRSYAADAASELHDLWRASGPQADELAACVEALADPDRMKRGRSQKLLVQLRESSRSILDALANSPDLQLRIFALETGKISLNPYFHDPLYRTIELNLRLMADPEETVRAAAIATAKPTILHNAGYLEMSLQRGLDNPMLGLLSQILARLNDPAPKVRAEAADVLKSWIAVVGQETLDILFGRGGQPAGAG